MSLCDAHYLRFILRGGTPNLVNGLAQLYAEPDLSITQWTPEKKTFADQNSQYRVLEAIYMRFSQGSADLVCLGDSITQKFPWQDAFYDRRVANRGIGSDTTEGILARLDSVVCLKPKTISLMAGINDLSLGRTVEETAESYQRLIRALQAQLPETKLIVSCVLPVTEKGQIAAADIMALNTKLAEICRDAGVVFLDMFQAFANENNALRPEYALDTVHLTVQGYALWLSYLVGEVQ